ncbi:MAG TPA: hypothetical protein VFX79_00850, partial [Candidatus Saccharimonadales bacterium]|nr:hypothetical protein [Candidatus Saccharimonadales bacterium]
DIPPSPEVNPDELGITSTVSLVRNNYEPATWAITLAAVSRLPAFIDPDTKLNTRDLLPEPLDIGDHIGNTALTFALTMHFANAYWGRSKQYLETDKEFEKKRKFFTVAVGAGTLVANTLGELVGYGSISTPDAVDFAYGLAGGLFAYKATMPHRVDAETVSLARKQDWWEEHEHLEELFTEKFPGRRRVKKTRAKKDAVSSVNISLPTKRKPHSVSKKKAARRKKRR